MAVLTPENKNGIFCSREIQLLVKLHREGFSILVLQSIVFAGVTVCVLGNVTVVKFLAGEFQLPWVMQPVVVQVCVSFFIIIVFILGRFGALYKVSSEKQANLWKSKRNKELRAFFRSCPLQRIFFGANNFFEAETCLNLEKFAFEQTASLLLLGK